MAIQNDQMISFTRAVPPVEALLDPEQMAELATVAIRNDAVTIQSYGNQAGYPALRTQLAAEFAVEEEQVLIGGEGSLQLLDLVAHGGEQSLVFVEQPSYDRAITTFRRYGARVVGVPLEDDGISVEQLEAAIKTIGKPRYVYLVPDSQNPTGVTLSADKRKAIINLAQHHGFTVIEDIPYRHLRYEGERQPMLRSLDDQVITLSSFSKMIAPGLRVGYVVAPEKTIASLVRLAEDTYISPALLNQAIVSEYMSRGLIDRQVEALTAMYRPKWQSAMHEVELLGGRVFPADGGFMVGVELSSDANVDRLIEQAHGAGVAITPGGPFYADMLEGSSADPNKFLRLPFCALSEDEFAEGIKRLAALL